MEPGGLDRGATYSVMAVLGAATHDFAGTRESRGPGTAPVTTQAAKAAQRPHLWHAWADARLDAAAGIAAGYWSSLLKRRAQILGRDLGLHAQSLGGTKWPCRIGQQRPSQQDYIRSAVRDDLRRMGRFGNQADRASGDARPVADRVGERDLVTGIQQRDFLLVRYAAGRAVDQVHQSRRGEIAG